MSNSTPARLVKSSVGDCVLFEFIDNSDQLMGLKFIQYVEETQCRRLNCGAESFCASE
jgi:hypothetical protein